MGTRKSKHKAEGGIAKRLWSSMGLGECLDEDSNARWDEIEQIANDLLGEKPLEMGEIVFCVSPVKLSGRPWADPYTRPLSESPNERKALKKKTGKCTGCGEPTYQQHGVCRVCYRAAAKMKQADRESYYAERAAMYEYWFDRSASAFEYDGEDETKTLFSYAKDFAPELIEEIAKKEIAYGIPFVFIPPESDGGRKRSVSHAKSRWARMFAHKPGKIRKIRRGKRTLMRGGGVLRKPVKRAQPRSRAA